MTTTYLGTVIASIQPKSVPYKMDGLPDPDAITADDFIKFFMKSNKEACLKHGVPEEHIPMPEYVVHCFHHLPGEFMLAFETLEDEQGFATHCTAIIAYSLREHHG